MTNVLRKRQNAKLRLSEVLQAIEYIHEDLKGHTSETLIRDRKTRQAAERNLEIIYEGQKGLLDEEKAAETGVDWEALRDNGNTFRHEYWKLTADQIMEEAVETMPALKEALLRMRDRMRKWDKEHPQVSSPRGRHKPRS